MWQILDGGWLCVKNEAGVVFAAPDFTSSSSPSRTPVKAPAAQRTASSSDSDDNPRGSTNNMLLEPPDSDSDSDRNSEAAAVSVPSTPVAAGSKCAHDGCTKVLVCFESHYDTEIHKFVLLCAARSYSVSFL